MAEEAKWYIIHTYSGYEALVKDTLEKLIENNNLQDKIFDIVIPMEETLEEKANGKKKVCERKKFPCYVFLKMNYSNDLWYLITNTKGVTGFVGPQGRALPLTEDEVARLELDKVAVDIDFVEGDTIQVMTGPFETYCGKVLSLDSLNQKVKVSLEVFGRKTDVEFEYVQVKKINAVDKTEDTQQ